MRDGGAGEQVLIGRVVVLLDASEASMAALEAAIELAARRHAELLALYVEEEELLRCAGYPWSREVGLSGAVRPLQAEALEERMRARAEAIRSALAQTAAPRGVRHRLQVSRGRLPREALALLAPEDLLVLGKIGYARARGQRVGSSAWAILHEAPGPVMVFERPLPEARPRGVAVVIDAGASGLQALESAAALLEPDEALTAVIACHAPGAAPEAAADPAQRWLAERFPQARWLPVTTDGPERIARLLAAQAAEKVVVSRRSAVMRRHDARELVEALQLPVVVIP
ncbi:universal stress protein [Halorhodospira neutriphila]|nr:universal stress protein [Halorhodospira neutriphila]